MTTRDRILAAAAYVMSRQGYSGTRLSDIADVAAIRPPAIYYYFTSREELLAEVMAVGQRSVLEHVQKALADLPGRVDPLERIDCAVRAHLEVELRLSDFATALIRNSGQVPEEVQADQRKNSHKYFDVWQELLEDARREGYISSSLDLKIARMLVMGALNWTAEWWNAEHGSLPQLIATAQRMVRGALSAAHDD